jgi:hypothetical protein
MKQNIFVLCILAFCMASCANDDDRGLKTSESKTVSVTFNVSGDFKLSTSPITRALTADGKAMTDVWVLDYVGGVLQQQVHQTSADADFGTPTLSLGLGDHHIYFVASRHRRPYDDVHQGLGQLLERLRHHHHWRYGQRQQIRRPGSHRHQAEGGVLGRYPNGFGNV